MSITSQLPISEGIRTLLKFLDFDVPLYRLKMNQTSLRWASRNTDVCPTGRKNPMDVFEHGLNFLLGIGFLIANDTIKCALVKNAQEWLLDYLSWLSDVHLCIYKKQNK